MMMEPDANHSQAQHKLSVNIVRQIRFTTAAEYVKYVQPVNGSPRLLNPTFIQLAKNVRLENTSYQNALNVLTVFRVHFLKAVPPNVMPAILENTRQRQAREHARIVPMDISRPEMPRNVLRVVRVVLGFIE